MYGSFFRHFLVQSLHFQRCVVYLDFIIFREFLPLSPHQDFVFTPLGPAAALLDPDNK